MDRKSIVPGLVATIVVFGFASGLALEHQNWRQLSEEQQALQQHLDRVMELVAANERQASLPAVINPTPSPAGDPADELLRLRTELDMLRQHTNDLEQARKANGEAHAALDRYLAASQAPPRAATADFWPRGTWNFAGYATPDDAVRSTLWASYNGNLQAMFDGATGDFRQMLEKQYAVDGKSADESAIRAMDEVSNLQSVEVLNRDQSDDTAVVTAAFQDGDQNHTTKLILKNIGGQWKIAGMIPSE